MTDHNPSKAHWGSQVDLTYLHGCRVSFYAQRKGFVHPLFGWISYKVWPQVSNGASTPLKQEEKTPLFRLKGVVVTFYGSLFNPLPPFSVTQPWHLFFPQPLWNCSDIAYAPFWTGFPSFWRTPFHDWWTGADWKARCPSELSGCPAGSWLWRRFCRSLAETAKTCQSQRLPHTTLRHCKNTRFFNGPFLN